MKKLTAGIFATILGLTAVDAFAAQVASTKYVQGAIDSLATVAKTGAYGDLTGTPSIPSIEGLATEAYVDQAEAAAIAAAATDATTKANAAEAAAIAAAATDATTKANTALTNAKAYTDSEIGEIGDMTVKAYVDAAKTAATYDDTALAARVGANETAISTLNTEQDEQDAAIKALQDAGYITNAALTGYATEAYVNQAETDAIAAAAEAAKIYIDDAELTAKGYAVATQVAQDIATAKSEAISSANSYTDSEIGEIGDMTVKAYVDAAKNAATYDDTALAARVGANETAISTLNTEQDEQDTEIAKKANSADVYAKTVADTTFVKVSDVVDEYVAPTAL